MQIGIWWGIATLIGVWIGSLLSMITYRLPVMIKQRKVQWICQQLGTHSTRLKITTAIDPTFPLNLFMPTSFCPHCKTPLVFFDKLPLMSWLGLKGHCRYCQTPIGWHYLLCELFTGIAAGYLARYYPFGITWILLLAFFSILLALAVIDLYEQLLPDSLTYSALWCGLLWHSINNSAFLPQSIFGVILGYLSFWSLYWSYKIFTGRDGLGYGDFKLLAALGAWFGWQLLPEIVVVAVVFTLFVIVMCPPLKRTDYKSIPFGPGLVLAGLIQLYFFV